MCVPNVAMLSIEKAGTILENIRHGSVIFCIEASTNVRAIRGDGERTRMIWPAALDATVGNISALVMAKPKLAVRTLCEKKFN